MIHGEVDKQEHLLWALYFLKVYPTEDVARPIAGDPKTFRLFAWQVIEALAKLRLVRVGFRLITFACAALGVRAAIIETTVASLLL